MPLLAAGMTLVPSPIPMSIAPCADERDQVGVDLVLELDVEPGVRVVAVLLGQVELGELDARDVAEADDELGRRRRSARAEPAAVARTADGGAGRRRPPAPSAPPALPQAGDERPRGRRATGEASTGDGDALATRGPPRLGGHGRASGHRRAGARRATTTRYRAIPTSAIVRSVANISGMSNSDPRARLIRTARPLLAPAHSPTIAPTTARVTPTRMPPKMLGSAAGISSVVRICRRVARRLRPSSSSRGVDGADPDHRGDGDREEDDQRADDDLARADPARTTDHEQRGQDEDRDGLGGNEVGRGETLEEGAPREPVADDQREPGADREAEDDLDHRRRRNAARPCRPARRRRTASPTVSGGGRMNGGEAGDDDDDLPDQDERRRRRATTGSQPERVTTRPPAARRRRRRRRPRRSGRSIGLGEVGPDLARGPGRGRIVEVGDRPWTRQVDRDVGDDATGARREHDDPVGDQDRLWDAVGDHHDRGRGTVPQPQQLEVEPFASQRVERAERLVEEEDRRLERERPGERHALARPARKLGRSRGGHRRIEADERRQCRQPCRASIGRPARQLERVGDVVGGRAPRQQARLLEDEPDPRVGAVDRRLAEERLAGDRPEQPCDDPQQRRLAAAVGPDERDDAAVRDGEVDAVEDRQGGPGPAREGERQVVQADGRRSV